MVVKEHRQVPEALTYELHYTNPDSLRTAAAACQSRLPSSDEPRNCTYPVITQNLKVARMAVPSLLKEVRRPLLRYQQHRNVIVHRESYSEEELSRVEMLYFVDHLPDEPGDDAVVSATDGLHHLRTQMLARLISEKRVEFNAVNTAVFALLLPLFNALESVYEGERLSLTILSVQSERLTP